MKYDRQLEFKNQKVRGNLMRSERFRSSFLIRLWSRLSEWMRRKVLEAPIIIGIKRSFRSGRDKDGNVTGFMRAELIPLFLIRIVCLVWEINERILKLILEFMKEYHISAYDEEKHQGLCASRADPVWIYDKRNHGLPFR